MSHSFSSVMNECCKILQNNDSSDYKVGNILIKTYDKCRTGVES